MCYSRSASAHVVNGVTQKVTQNSFNGFSQHNESFKRQYLEMSGVVEDAVDDILITHHSDRERKC